MFEGCHCSVSSANARVPPMRNETLVPMHAVPSTMDESRYAFPRGATGRRVIGTSIRCSPVRYCPVSDF